MELSKRAQMLLAEERERYVSSLAAKRDAIRKAWHQLSIQKKPPHAVDEFMQLIHRLAGSAGSYGMDQLSDAARVLEDVLIAEQQNNPTELTIQVAFQDLMDAFAIILKRMR